MGAEYKNNSPFVFFFSPTTYYSSFILRLLRFPYHALSIFPPESALFFAKGLFILFESRPQGLREPLLVE
jgi:hypothetical protein